MKPPTKDEFLEWFDKLIDEMGLECEIPRIEEYDETSMEWRGVFFEGFSPDEEEPDLIIEIPEKDLIN